MNNRQQPMNMFSEHNELSIQHADIETVSATIREEQLLLDYLLERGFVWEEAVNWCICASTYTKMVKCTNACRMIVACTSHAGSMSTEKYANGWASFFCKGAERGKRWEAKEKVEREASKSNEK